MASRWFRRDLLRGLSPGGVVPYRPDDRDALQPTIGDFGYMHSEEYPIQHVVVFAENVRPGTTRSPMVYSFMNFETLGPGPAQVVKVPFDEVYEQSKERMREDTPITSASFGRGPW